MGAGRGRWDGEEDVNDSRDESAGNPKKRKQYQITEDEEARADVEAIPTDTFRKGTAADIAMAEVLEFRQRQLALAQKGIGQQQNAYMKASPSVSSEEEDMHIKREVLDYDYPLDEEPILLKDIADTTALPCPETSPATSTPSSPIKEKEQEDSASLENKGRVVSMLNECQSVEKYEKLNRISEGTYGVVYRARNKATGEICALKKVKLEKETDGFPLTSIREINILLSLSQHPNIVNVSEIVVGYSLDAVFMVMEYADHDLRSVMKDRMKQPFTTAEVKCLMLQLLSGVAYLHDNWVIHRDLKTSNILYTNRGQLKICDFGLARQYGSPLKPYTHMVVTLWYRAPELLLGGRLYSTAVDVWSIGCIMGELLCKQPLFAGKSELAQLDLIFKTLGSPTEDTWPGVDSLPETRKFNFAGKRYKNVLRTKFPLPGPIFDGRPCLSDAGFDLLSGLLELCPRRRLSAEDALHHPWFSEHPMPKDPALMPTFPATNEALHRDTHH